MLVRSSRVLFFLLILIASGSIARQGFAQPNMTVTPDPLDFLEVNLTDIKDAEIEIQSKEAIPFVVQNIYLTNGNARDGEFTILSPSVKTFALMPDEKRKIILRFAPDFEGQRTRVLIIQTDLGDQIIQLEGTGKLTKPVLTLSTTNLDFGQIGVTGKKEVQIEIANVGEDAAKISDLTITNFTGIEHFKVVLDDPSLSFPVILLKGEKLMLKASFEGAYPLGFKTGSMVLVGSVGGQTVVQFTGEVIAGDLKIEPSPIDFGDVEIGTPKRKTVTITALGSLSLTIEYMNEMFAPFAYVVAPDVPFTIEPGKPYEFEIEINATDAGPIASQLQVVSQDLEGSSLRVADIIANVLTPLRIAESQDFSYFCGSKLGVEREITLSNRGINPITIESLNVPTGVTLITELPVEVPAGGSAVFDYAFDPSFGFGGRELVFEFESVAGVVLIRDTVEASQTEASLPLVQTISELSTESSNIAVTSAFDFTSFAFSDITLQIDIARPDLFELFEDSIVLNEVLLPNATHDLTDNGNGSYTLVIHSQDPIAFASQLSLADQPLFTYNPVSYITTDDESVITMRLVLDTLCTSTPISSALLVAQKFCGSEYVHQVLRDQPLSNIVLSPNPWSFGVIRISYTASIETPVHYRIVSMNGEVVATGDFQSSIGQNSNTLSTSPFAGGNYLFELSSPSGFVSQQQFVVVK